MPGNVQEAIRPMGRSSSSATKHHSGCIEPAANMLSKYCSTSLRWSGEPAAPTKRSSSSARTGRVRISKVLLRQRGDVANDGLGFAQSKHDLETHRPPKGVGSQYTQPTTAKLEGISRFTESTTKIAT